MKNQFIGFKVRLTSSQLGEVVGTVCNVTQSKIELSDAVLNNKGTLFDLIAVESQYIQDIRILATRNADGGGCDGSSDDVAGPSKVREKRTVGRAERRELLRNLPNTCNAYVCPESPPLVRNTSGSHNVTDGRLESSPRQASRLLQTLDSALANVKVTDRQAKHRSRKYHPAEKGGGKRQNFPMSDPMMSSELSGTESDSMGLLAYPPGNRAMTMLGQFNGGSNGCRQSWSRSRGLPGSHRTNGNRQMLQQQQQVPPNIRWDQLRVEDFMDQEFDFEKNLAMFDKNAFYEMVDTKKQGGNTVVTQNSCNNTTVAGPPTSRTFDEGPDGVGVPLMGTVPHSIRTNRDYKPSEFSNNCTMTTNTATESASRKQPLEHTCQPSHELDREMCDRAVTNRSTDSRAMADTNLASSVSSGYGVCSTLPYLRESMRLVPQDWYSPTGQRIPLLTTEDRDRLLAYLATGLDPLKQQQTVKGKAATGLGLTWGRLLETSARSLTDYLMQQVHLQPPAGQSTLKQTSQRLNQAPPIRVLIVPGGPHLSGAMTLTLARLLTNRGACVLLLAPAKLLPTSSGASGSAVKSMTSMDEVYRTELDLLLRMAPRLNQYGLEDDDDGEVGDLAGRFVGASGDDRLDFDDDDDSEEDRQEVSGLSDGVCNPRLDEAVGHARADFVVVGSCGGEEEEEDELDVLLRQSWLLGANARSDSEVASSSRTLTNSLGGCQGTVRPVSLATPAAAAAVVDYSPVNRMWISRMPGLKLLRRVSFSERNAVNHQPNPHPALARLSTDVCVDLVIVAGRGQTAGSTATDVRPHLVSWLARHQAVSRLVHLLPTDSGGGMDELVFSTSSFGASGHPLTSTTVVEMGLPTVSPEGTEEGARATSHCLVDVGLTRSHVRRLTGDLKALPPYGLFAGGSVIQLQASRSLQAAADQSPFRAS